MKRETLVSVALMLALSACAHVHTNATPRYHFGHSVLNHDKSGLQPRSFTVPDTVVHNSNPASAALRNQNGARSQLETQHLTNATPTSHSVAITNTQTRRPLRAPEIGTPIKRAQLPHIDETGSNSGESTETLSSPTITPEQQPTTRETVSSNTVVTDGPQAVSTSTPVEVTPLRGSQPEAKTTTAIPPLDMKLVDRAALLDAARRLVGTHHNFTPSSFIENLLRVNNSDNLSDNNADWLKELYKRLRDRGQTYDRQQPTPGDLVFFHNTDDHNGDGRNNDWYSACGVVNSVDANGTITFIVYTNDTVQELVMNLGRPEVRRDESVGATLNSFLRAKRMSDPEYTQYLSGELFAGFATVATP